jgi:hypothetical protein
MSWSWTMFFLCPDNTSAFRVRIAPLFCSVSDQLRPELTGPVRQTRQMQHKPRRKPQEAAAAELGDDDLDTAKAVLRKVPASTALAPFSFFGRKFSVSVIFYSFILKRDGIRVSTVTRWSCSCSTWKSAKGFKAKLGSKKVNSLRIGLN